MSKFYWIFVFFMTGVVVTTTAQNVNVRMDVVALDHNYDCGNDGAGGNPEPRWRVWGGYSGGNFTGPTCGGGNCCGNGTIDGGTRSCGIWDIANFDLRNVNNTNATQMNVDLQSWEEDGCHGNCDPNTCGVFDNFGNDDDCREGRERVLNINFRNQAPCQYNEYGFGYRGCGYGVKVNVYWWYASLNAGGISGSQTYCASGNPPTITSTSAGTTAWTNYTWERQNNCTGAWTTIAGATGATYNPGTLTQTTCFRRRVNSCNISAVSNTVTITITSDNQAPVIQNCPSNITTTTDAGVCGANVSYTAPTSATDNCTSGSLSVTRTAGPASGGLFGVGPTTVTYEAVDNAGNTGTCSFIVTVNDEENPTANCPSDITVDADANSCSAIVDYNVTSSDNCPGSTVALLSGTISGGTFPVGTTPISWRATDAAGNTADCSFSVTVEDNEDPEFDFCPSNQTVSTDNGVCTANVSYSTPSPDDNCPGVTAAVDNPSFASGSDFPLGTNTVTWVATDVAGNTANCVFDIIVEDNENPVITNCPPDIPVNTDPGQCSAVVTWSAPDVSDNCTVAPIIDLAAGSLPAGSPFPIGSTDVTYEAQDAAGNDATDCVFTVTVTDNEAPGITCPSDTTVSNETGFCTAEVTFSDATATDNCSGSQGVPTVDQIAGDPSGFDFPVGMSTVSFRATDAANNTADCSFTITVNDTEFPTVSNCPSDTVFEFTELATCSATVDIFDPAAVDNCPGSSLSLDSPSGDGDVFSLGSTQVEYTATDAAGNETECDFVVTVLDNEFPTVVCPVSEVVTFPNCQFTIDDATGDPGIVDNCDQNLDVVQSFVGVINQETTITITATDDAGNASTCAWTVAPFDNTPPTFDACPTEADSVIVNSSCQFVMPDYSGLDVTDVCNPTLMFSQVPDVGTIQSLATSVTVTVSDGTNDTDCVFNVVPKDTISPTFNCPADKIVSANPSCEFVLQDYSGEATNVLDNCAGAPTVVQQPASGQTISGTATIELVATDAAGNEATCAFTVTVDDDTPPVASCPADQDVYYNASCVYTMEDFVADASATDNCPGTPTLLQSPTPGTSISGTSTFVTITATDAAGNEDTCMFALTILDNISPSISCPQPQPRSLNASCEYAMEDFTGDAMVSDGCPGAVTVTQDITPVTSVYTGTQTVTVTLTATDVALNTAQCSLDLSLIDDTAPSITCGADLAVSFNGSDCSFTVGNRTSHYTGLADNCSAPGDIDVTQSPSSSTVALGQTTVTLTATDESGNTSTCNFDLIPSDNQSPTVDVCPQTAFEVSLDANCDYTIADYTSEADFDDNCDQSLTITQSPAFGTVVTTQANTSVTITATDDAGNSNFCTVTVEPSDNTSPTIDCPADVTVSVNQNCQFVLQDYTTQATVDDNCDASPSIVQDPVATTVITGSQTVELEVTDAAGNMALCTFVVSSEDDTPPSIQCPADQDVSFNTSCQFNITDYTGLATNVDDNCDDVTDIVVSQSLSVGASIGDTTQIVLTATDLNGNASTCTFDVNPSDNTIPTISCPADVVLDANAACLYNLGDYTSDAITNDFCDTQVDVTQSPLPTNNIALGVTTSVMLTATDDAGNPATCSFNVSAEDNTAPSITCPTDTVVTTDASCQFTMIDETSNHELVVSDNCPGVSVIGQSPAAGSVLTSNTAVTLTAQDAAGNTSSCTYEYTVEDQVDPTIACPSDQLISSNAACVYVIPDFTNSALVDDNCAGALTVTQSPLPNINSIVVDTLITLTVTDGNGNTASCDFLISADDGLLPNITCPGNQLVGFDANCEYDLIDYTSLANATDNCGSPTISQVQPVDSTITGTTTIELVAEDADMNTASCTFQVIPSDLDAPVLSCSQPAITVSASGQCSVQLDDYTTSSYVSATDNCSGPTFTFSQSPVAGALIGGPTVVTISTSDAEGNIGSCTMTVTPEDNTPPALVCPADAIVSLDANCEYDILDYTGLVFVSDNCDSAPFAITQFPSPDSTITGEHAITVQLSVADAAMNTGSCSLTVTTVDDVAPTITCPADDVVAANSDCEFALGNYIGDAVVSDNCTPSPALVQSPASGDFSGNVSVTITATDDAGNTNTCSFNVSTEDNTAPNLTCPPNQTPDFTANCQFTLVDYTSLATFSDFCDNTPFISQSPGIGTLISGDTTITITVVDAAGNDSTCTFQVSPLDVTAPEVECPDDFEVVASASCDYTISDYASLLIIDDNCDADPVIVQTPSNGNGSISGAGANQQISMLVTDASGNFASCSFNITLVDETVPMVTCPQDQEVDFGPSCQFPVPSYLGQATASDNCDSPGDIALSQSPLSGSSVGGTTTVTISAEDGSGNVGTCTFLIIPDDNQAPNIFGCPADITVDNDAGVCSAVVTYAAITATDNCDGVVVPTVTQGQASGTVFPLGPTAVEFTAIDVAGNSNTCQFTVTVVDAEDPIVICPTDVSVNVDANTCTAVVVYAPVTATDNCTNPISATTDPSLLSGETFSLGTTTVMYSAMDEAGNVGTCSFDVTVVDDEDPVITCPADIVTNTGTNSCNAFVSYNLPTVTDNCASGIVPSLTSGQNSGSSFAQGITTVSYLAEDGNGNSTTCSFTITVEDNEVPLILACPLDITENVEPGTCGATIIYADINATDNCAGQITPTLTLGQASGTVFEPDTTTVLYVADDGNGNTTTCSFLVTIIDNEDPVITCPANVSITAEVNTCGADVAYPLPTVTDNCTSPITPMLEVGGASGDNFPVGPTTVTYSADDGNGNTATCSFTVVVTDDEMPEITCPADITVDNDPGVCGAVVGYQLPTVTDNCTSGIIPTQTLGLASGETFPVGTTVNRYQAVDASGNMNFCSFIVIVNDVEDPVLTCPADVTVSTDPSVCQAVATYDPISVSDNCTSGIIPVLQSGLSSGDPFPEGTTVVTYIGTDAYGNSSTCSFNVTVDDNEAPAVTCPQNQTEAFDPSCQLSVPNYTGLGLTTDNCDGSPVITQMPAPSSIVTGTTIVTLTSTDFSGNASTCTFTVTDNTPPMATCPGDQQVGFNINCEYDLPDYTLLAVSSDNCGATSLSQSPAVGMSISTQTTVIITVEDDFGNTATCDFEVIPSDDIPPSITCIGNQTALFDANCQFQLPDYTNDVQSEDNCDTQPTLTQVPTAGSIVTENTEITVTTTDNAGNETSCSFMVNLVDNLPPSIACPSTQTEFANDSCWAALSDYTSLAVTGDACDQSGIVVTQTPSPSTLVSGGGVVTLTAADASGNTATCVFLVEIMDNTPPTIVCPENDTVSFNEDCEFVMGNYLSLALLDDNCAQQVLVSQSIAPNTTLSTNTLVELTASDGNGNSATCSFTVVPEDNVPPVVVTCSTDLNPSLNSNCEFEIGDYLGLGSAVDNCTSVSTVQIPAPGAMISTTTQVSLIFTDDFGNESSCDFLVDPTDQEPPSITCQDDQVVSFDTNCEFELPDYAGSATVTDFCSNNIEVEQGFATSSGGFPGDIIYEMVTISLTATDEFGNADSCEFTVTPMDMSPPSILCPADQTVQLNSTCEFEVGDYATLVTASDNCGLDSQSQLPAVGTPVTGATEITMSATDNAGNTNSCTFMVTPEDGEAPTITCPANVTVDIDQNCQFELLDYTGDAVVVDNCGTTGGAVTQFPPQGTVVVTSTVITLTASDSNGNESDCSFAVELEDDTAPEITSCPSDQELELGSNCSADMPDFTGLVTATDNCDVSLEVSQIPAAGSSVTGAGTQTVTITVQDSQGNSDVCEFTLTTTDESDPTIACPANQVLALTASCAFIVPDYTSLADVDDACGGDVTVTQSPIPGSVITAQLNATLIAEDEDGNTATCTFFVDVIDYEMEVTGTDASCEGGSDGTATVTVTGGEAPYTEDWGGFDPNALAPGTYAVIVEDANGCILTDEVTIGDGPTFAFELSPSGNVVVCNGTSVSIDAGDGYADYDWSTGASVQTITVTNEGDYWVTVTSAEGCVADDTVSVSFFNAQSPSIDPDTDGVLYCSNDTAQSYQWYLNGDPIPDATNSYYCPLQSGNYYVEIVDENGCVLSSEIEEHTYNDSSPCATSIDEYGLTLDVYPNPSNGIYTVSYSLDHQAELQLSVVDLVGRQVTTEIKLTALSGNQVIDISDEADGVYILRIVKDGERMLQERLMLVK